MAKEASSTAMKATPEGSSSKADSTGQTSSLMDASGQMGNKDSKGTDAATTATEPVGPNSKKMRMDGAPSTSQPPSATSQQATGATPSETAPAPSTATTGSAVGKIAPPQPQSAAQPSTTVRSQPPPSALPTATTASVSLPPGTSAASASAVSASTVPPASSAALPGSKKRPRPHDPVGHVTLSASPPPPPTLSPAVSSGSTSWPVPLQAVQQTVGNVLHLLQTYGPLTAGQVEYNLPPVPTHAGAVQQPPVDLATGVRSPPYYSVQDILHILVAVGVVQQIQGDPSAATSSATTPPPPPRYACQAGIPRADPVVIRRPAELLKRIEQAVTETEQSQQRQEILLQALAQWQPQPGQKNSTKSTTTPRAVLTQLLKDAPELVQDPVYATALRICHVDMTAAGGALLGTTGSASKSAASASVAPKGCTTVPSQPAASTVSRQQEAAVENKSKDAAAGSTTATTAATNAAADPQKASATTVAASTTGLSSSLPPTTATTATKSSTTPAESTTTKETATTSTTNVGNATGPQSVASSTTAPTATEKGAHSGTPTSANDSEKVQQGSVTKPSTTTDTAFV